VYKSLEIENFRGLRHLELPRLAPITILTGRNNIGKTAVLEALFLHAAGPRAAQLFLLALRPSRLGASINIEVSKRSNPWETAFYNKDTHNAIRLSAQLDDENIIVELSNLRQISVQQISSTLETESAVNASTSDARPGLSYAMHIKVNSVSVLGQTYQMGFKEFTQTVSAQLGQVFAGPTGLQQASGLNFSLQPEENSDAVADAYFVGPQTRYPQAELAQRYTNLRLRGLDKDFLNALRALEPALESIEILAPTTPTLYFTLRGGPPLPITVMGEGMLAIANYAATIFETPGGLVLIDEVENGIHYSALENVWTQIGRAVKDTGTQVVASTHSYDCVRAAYRAFHDDPDTLQLIRLQSGEDSPAAIEAVDYDLESLKGALDMNLDVR
jgi:AAA domain, putative AbiEii toxin, Type IV TA system/AAA ATPase domain